MAWRQFCGVCEDFYDTHKTAINRMRDLLDMAEEHLDSYGNTDAEYAEKMLEKYEDLVGEIFNLAEGILNHLHNNGRRWIVYGEDVKGGWV